MVFDLLLEENVHLPVYYSEASQGAFPLTHRKEYLEMLEDR